MSGWEELRAALDFIDKHADDYNPARQFGPLLTVERAHEWIVAAKTVRAALSGSTAPLDVERLARVLDGSFSDGTDRWRLVPMTEDGGLSVTAPSSWLAEAIADAYADLAAASPDPAQGGDGS